MVLRSARPLEAWEGGWGALPAQQSSQMWGQLGAGGAAGSALQWLGPILGSGRQSPPCRDTCRAACSRGRGRSDTPEPGLGSVS